MNGTERLLFVGLYKLVCGVEQFFVRAASIVCQCTQQGRSFTGTTKLTSQAICKPVWFTSSPVEATAGTDSRLLPCQCKDLTLLSTPLHSLEHDTLTVSLLQEKCHMLVLSWPEQ